MVLIKKNVLSASIATVLLGSTGAFAANDRGFTSDTDWSEEQAGFNGHVGTTFEYETKSTDNYLGKTVKEYTKTHEIFQAYFSQPNWQFAAIYGLKSIDRRQEEKGYHENETSLQNYISLNKTFTIGNGFDFSLVYDLMYTDGNIDSPYVTGLHTVTVDNSFRPTLTYFNSDWNAGFYSNVEYLYSRNDKSSWGVREEEGQSILFQPYKRFGAWEFGIEFFYQKKHNDEFNHGKINDRSIYTETYYEPIIKYAFENAGNLYLRTRFGHGKTENADSLQYNANRTYFKTIRKSTLGYEQNIGDDWIAKIEYKHAWEKEHKNFYDPRDEEKYNVLNQDNIYVHAFYRF
ncbi:TPA: porin [Escherichia coli]